MKWLWVVAISTLNVSFWIVIWFIQKEAKALEVTEQSNKYFFEPIANLGMLIGLISLLWIWDIIH